MCTGITLGLGVHIDEFTRMIRAKVGVNVESFPFPSLSVETDSTWQGIRRAMNNAGEIHFNGKAMSKENFQAWMRRGGHLTEPCLIQRGWTNSELYEVLSIPGLKSKTTFHDFVGEINEWLVEP